VIPILEERCMSWSLRLVKRVDGGDGRSVDVVDIGEITGPTELAMLGLTTVTAKSALATLQTQIVALQEAALTEAARRAAQPIKDHRRRVLQRSHQRQHGCGDHDDGGIHGGHVRAASDVDAVWRLAVGAEQGQQRHDHAGRQKFHEARRRHEHQNEADPAGLGRHQPDGVAQDKGQHRRVAIGLTSLSTSSSV
jgi:hypothetical protein